MDSNLSSREHILMCIFFTILWLLSFQAQALEVATWNVEKGRNTNWSMFLNENSQIDFWGIQESTKDLYKNFFQPNYDAHYNQAWETTALSTGTLAASTKKQLDVLKVVTEVYEPILKTPKSFTVSTLEDCGKKVKILNTHMINFTFTSEYKKQLLQMGDHIKDHKGPLIILGDFNNWNIFRTKALKNWLESYDLKSHLEKNEIQSHTVDHIFYRGLNLIEYKEHSVGLADHEPITAVFNCNHTAVL